MNYIGSKYSLLDFIQNTIDQVTGLNPESGYKFADLFAGTGIVGSTYKKRGCNVIANDIQYYSYVINRHLIENTNLEEKSLLSYLNSLNGVDGFIFQNYCVGSSSGRNYFTDENGRKCDAIRIELNNLREQGDISEDIYFWFLASLINSIDKYANTASVYGAFLKHVKASAQKEFSLELLPVIDGKKGITYNSDINKLIRDVEGDVLYLDPPYNSRQYCTNYHLLETIAKYDSPMIYGKTGIREYKEQKSLFCSSRTVASAFEDLIANANFEYIFLSYNNEGLMPIDLIQSILSKYGEYSQYTIEHRRFKADKDENRNISTNHTVEYLHCLKKG